jgi:hypothetical protein
MSMANPVESSAPEAVLAMHTEIAVGLGHASSITDQLRSAARQLPHQAMNFA